MVMMGWIGTTELAAHGIALQIISVTFMVHIGLSSAATVRAGRAWGRGDRRKTCAWRRWRRWRCRRRWWR
jgi:Na+-driven multidrug efflux pump